MSKHMIEVAWKVQGWRAAVVVIAIACAVAVPWIVGVAHIFGSVVP